MRLLQGMGIIVALVILVAIVGAGDKADAKVKSNTYCEMVSQHYDSGGKDGWPDYKGIYEVSCAEYDIAPQITKGLPAYTKCAVIRPENEDYKPTISCR